MKNTIKKEMIIRSKMMFFIFQVKKSGTLLIINPAINKTSLAKCMYFKKERSGKGVLFYPVYKKSANCSRYLTCKREPKTKVIKRKARLYKDSFQCVIKNQF